MVVCRIETDLGPMPGDLPRRDSITRPGPLGNPIALGKPCPICGVIHTRDSDGTAALVCAARHFYRRLKNEGDFQHDVLMAASWSAGMVCVCAPAPCHGDIFLQFAEAYNERVAISGDADLALASGLRAVADQAATWKIGQTTLAV